MTPNSRAGHSLNQEVAPRVTPPRGPRQAPRFPWSPHLPKPAALVAPASGLLAVAILLGASCQGTPLRARQVTDATAATDLFGGSDATGGVGDWVLTNGLVEAIVDDVGFQADILAATGAKVPIQTGVARSGGMLVDLGLYGVDNDQLAIVYPLLSYDAALPLQAFPASEELGSPGLGSIVRAVDAAAGIASLTVHGRALVVPGLPAASQPLRFRQIYSVRRGERFLRMRTEVENTDAVATFTLTGIADSVLLGPGGPIPFVPYPSRGFALAAGDALVPFLTWIGLNGPADGVVGDAGSTTEEASYTLAAPDDPTGSYLFTRTTEAAAVVGANPHPTLLAPGQILRFDRRLYVGRRGDVAASAAPALAAIAARTALPTGSLAGSITTSDGGAFRASIEITQVDLDPQTPAPETLVTLSGGGTAPLPLLQLRTDTALGGAFAVSLPTGRYELRIQAEEREPVGPVPFLVSPDATTDLGSFALSSNGALQYEVRDADSGLLIPARLTVKGAGRPDPQLGAPVDLSEAGVARQVGSRASIPYGNTIYTASGTGTVRLRPGNYRVIASRGPEYGMAWQDVTVPTAGSASVAFAIAREVDTTGWLAADFHVHASPSPDSSVPPRDRAVSLAGEGVEVMVSAATLLMICASCPRFSSNQKIAGAPVAFALATACRTQSRMATSLA